MQKIQNMKQKNKNLVWCASFSTVSENYSKKWPENIQKSKDKAEVKKRNFWKKMKKKRVKW